MQKLGGGPVGTKRSENHMTARKTNNIYIYVLYTIIIIPNNNMCCLRNAIEPGLPLSLFLFLFLHSRFIIQQRLGAFSLFLSLSLRINDDDDDDDNDDDDQDKVEGFIVDFALWIYV